VFHRPLRRPLALVALLSLGDYLLWNWSLNGNHDVVALIAGTTLVPLLIALVWLLALGSARLVAGAARQARARASARAGAFAEARSRRSGSRPSARDLRAAAASDPARGRRAISGTGAGEAPSPASPSSKLAA
jgi:hypothetical protein